MHTHTPSRFFTTLFASFLFALPAVAVNIVQLTESVAFRTFIDLDSIETLNPKEKTFRTIDNVKSAASPMASSVTLWKMDCSNARMQVLRLTSFTDLFGRGQVLRDNIGQIPGFNGGPALKMEELSASGEFRPHYDRVCATEPVQSMSPLQVEDIKCNKTAFLAAVLRDPANPARQLPQIDRSGRSPTGSAMAAIVSKSARGKSLPKWIGSGSSWVADESMISADCVKWNDAEWYLRDVFWQHNAPDGNGFIAVNLTQGVAYFILARDTSLTERTITHTLGLDPKVVTALREGFMAPFDAAKSPRSCYFVPKRAVCKG